MVRFAVFFFIFAICMSFGVAYHIVNCRRHPNGGTQKCYSTMLCMPMMNMVLGMLYALTMRESWPIIAGFTLVAWGCWAPMLFRDYRIVRAGGPEALLARWGGAEAQYRDIWEWIYVRWERIKGWDSGLWATCLKLGFFVVCGVLLVPQMSPGF